MILYQDAFEVVNPLGSAKKTKENKKKTKHKMLGVCFTLAKFDAFHRSTVDNLQLLRREADFIHFGHEKVFFSIDSRS